MRLRSRTYERRRWASRKAFSAAASAARSRSCTRPSFSWRAGSARSGPRSRRVGVIGVGISTRRSTTWTAERPDAAARVCSPAWWRQVVEHHFGIALGTEARSRRRTGRRTRRLLVARCCLQPRGRLSRGVGTSPAASRSKRPRRWRSRSRRHARKSALPPRTMDPAPGRPPHGRHDKMWRRRWAGRAGDHRRGRRGRPGPAGCGPGRPDRRCLPQVEAVELHDLDPRRNEVPHELLLRVG